MSTRLLAQQIVSGDSRRFIEFEHRRRGFDPHSLLIMERCIKALSLPWDGTNHLTLPHPSLGPVYAREAEVTHAPVYHFDQHAVRAAWLLIEKDRRRKLILDIARAPHPRCFFEWTARSTGEPFGIYVEQAIGIARFISWRPFTQPGKPTLVVPEHEGEWGRRSDGHTWTRIRTALTLKDVNQEWLEESGQRLPWMVLSFWAFLAATGAVNVARTPAPRLSGKYKHAGAPILSYNRVRLSLPRHATERDGTVVWERGPGVRRHEVAGHWHTYRVGPRNNQQTLLHYVEAFWRGNARLGLVLKNYDVTKR